MGHLLLFLLMPAAVLTDSTSDLPSSVMETLGIYKIALSVNFDSRVWLDHTELSSAELFRRVASGAGMPSTRPPSVETYRDTLEQLLQQHDHVFALHISSKLSDTYAHATEAARAFPGRVTVQDSRNATAGLALEAERASQLLRSGTPPELVAKQLASLRPRAQTNMCVNTLSYLRKNGRIGGAAALLGNLLHVKPVLGLREGKVEAVGRALGSSRAIKEMSKLLDDYVTAIPNARVGLFHNGNEEGVDELHHVCRRHALPTLWTLELGAVISAHGGPGVFGFSIEPVA